MALGVRQKRETDQAEKAIEEHARNVAAFPLAMPLMAGPGAITATLLLAGRAQGDMRLMAILLGIIVAVCLICMLVFFAAGRVARAFGDTGNVVLSRLLGVVLGRACGAIHHRRRAANDSGLTMSAQNPSDLVSVVIPACDAQAHLPDAIASCAIRAAELGSDRGGG